MSAHRILSCSQAERSRLRAIAERDAAVAALAEAQRQMEKRWEEVQAACARAEAAYRERDDAINESSVALAEAQQRAAQAAEHEGRVTLQNVKLITALAEAQQAHRETVRKARRELWIHDPPLSLPPEQTTGWNNALVAFERRMLAVKPRTDA